MGAVLSTTGNVICTVGRSVLAGLKAAAVAIGKGAQVATKAVVSGSQVVGKATVSFLNASKNAICAVSKAALPVIKSAATKGIEITVRGAQAVAKGAQTAAKVVARGAQTTAKVVANGARATTKSVARALNTSKNAICSISKTSFKALRSGVSRAAKQTKAVVRGAGKVTKNIGTTLRTTTNRICRVTGSQLRQIKGKVANFTKGVGTFSRKVSSKVVNNVDTMKKSIGEGISNMAQSIKDANIAGRIKNGLNSAKNRITTVVKPKLQSLRENVSNKYRLAKAHISTSIQNFERRVSERAAEYAEYRAAMQLYREQAAAMKQEDISNGLNSYSTVTPETINPEAVLLAEAMNNTYRQNTGRDNEAYLSVQPQIINFFIDNRDYYVQNGLADETFFAGLEILKIKFDIMLSDLSPEEKESLFEEITALQEQLVNSEPARAIA